MRVRGRTAIGLAALIAVAAFAPAVHAARAWRAPLQLSAAGADAWIGKEVPSLSVMSDGTTVAAWREEDGDRSAVKVLEKPAGATSGEPQTLGGGMNPPSVATALTGKAY